jgi:hypothetical protein
MTELHYFAIQVAAFAAGVGVFFGAFGRDDPAPRVRELVTWAAAAMAALAGSYFLAVHRHLVSAVALTVFPLGFLTTMLRNALDGWRRRWVRRGLWVAALGIAIVAIRIAGLEADRIMLLQDMKKEREAKLAQEITELRRPWSADPDRGVTELKMGRLTVWLAAAPRIDIDAEYERELGEKAQREVPIRVVFLNDSFMPVTTEAAPALTPLHWSVKIQDADGGVLREWRIEPADPRALQPAERRDYQVAWDGCDGSGTLAPPGDYAVAIEVETAQGRAAQSLPLRIMDAGPSEIVEVDATTRYIQHQQEMMRWNQTLQQGMQTLEQMRSHNWHP